MSGAISQASKQEAAEFFQFAAQISTIGGSVTTLAYAVLGRDCTYPLTVTTLGACAWFSIWLTQSAYKDAMQHQKYNEALSKNVQKELDPTSDALGTSVKKMLKKDRDLLVEKCSKIAVLSPSLFNSLNPLAPVAAYSAGCLITAVGNGTKDISDKSIDSSVDASENFVARSISKKSR